MRYQLEQIVPEDTQETTRERARRQRSMRRAELTYSADDEKRWAENRERVQATKKYESIRNVISQTFVTESHMLAIKECADLFDMVITVRESGALTIDALNRGAAAKGHDILEKTIKPSTLEKIYNVKEPQQQVIKNEGLMGMVGHAITDDAGQTILGGVYSSIYEKDSDGKEKAKIFPLDTSTVESLSASILTMKNELGANWITKLFTGDYDMHDLLIAEHSGSYRIVEPESQEERESIENINLYVSAVDKKREYQNFDRKSNHEKQARHVIRHGAQVNYGWHQMLAEPDAKIVKPVAVAGKFPLAYYSAKEKRWGMIESFKELKTFYASHNAAMPFYWTNSELDLDTQEVHWQSIEQDKTSQSPMHVTINKEHFKSEDHKRWKSHE